MSVGLLDTSVVLAVAGAVAPTLPDVAHVSAITMAELVQGPPLARDEEERRRRRVIVLAAHRAFPSPLPFDGDCIAAYQSVVERTVGAGRRARGRTLDLLIAATALAHGMALFTANPADVAHLDDIVEVVEVT